MNNKLIASLFSLILCFIGPQEIALMSAAEGADDADAAQVAHAVAHEQAAFDSDDEDDEICSCFCCPFLMTLWRVREHRERTQRPLLQRPLRKQQQKED